MAKTKAQKQDLLTSLKERWTRTKSMVFSDYSGLKVAELEDLRRQLKDSGSEYLVVKKTLLSKLFKESGIQDIDPRQVPGELAVAFGYEDEIAPAKIIATLSKKYEALTISGGMLEGKFMSAERIIALSKLPSKDQLIAQVVGSIRAPLSGLVGVLQGNLRNLVYALNAIREQKTA